MGIQSKRGSAAGLLTGRGLAEQAQSRVQPCVRAVPQCAEMPPLSPSCLCLPQCPFPTLPLLGY